MLPPIPSWDAVHPIVVHLPIGVLSVLPLMLLWTMCVWTSRKTAAGMTLLLLCVGTGGLALAAVTGEAAESAVIVPGLASDVFDRHEDLGEMARNIFLGITAMYVLVVLLAVGLKDKFKRPLWVGAHVLVLAAVGAGLMVLVNAGHLGGRLVHEFGVRAPMGTNQAGEH